jgi:hypothetical protein
MGSNMKVFLFGSLKKNYSGVNADKPIALNLSSPAPLPEILATLGIPEEKVRWPWLATTLSVRRR